MRSISTLATLLVGMAVVFWAPAAKADCPHNNDDTHQHCGGGTPATNSGPFQFVGYSSTPRFGDVGVRAMYEACQDDFGLEARVCSETEFLQSPNVEIPSSFAWLGATSSSNCNYWSSSLGTALVVEDFAASGKIRLRVEACTSELPITCCARLP